MRSRVQVLRAERRITQQQLADMSGVGVHTVRDWEADRIGGAKLETLLKVADALGVEVADLYERGEEAGGA